MAYKEKNRKFRGVIMVNGNRMTKSFDTQGEARKWETEEKARLTNLTQTRGAME